MKQWQIFEKDCLNYLIQTNNDVNKKYISKGSADSTTSDIQVIIDERMAYFIEAKMPKSQCGQFVLLKDKNNEYYYSDKNKLNINDFSKIIIKHINENKLNELNKKSIPLELDQNLIIDYIIEHYKEKQVKYIITRKKDKYELIPLIHSELKNHFNFIGTLRMKKSGSRSLTKTLEDKLIMYMGDDFVNKETSNEKILYSLNKDGDFIINIDGYDLYFKQQENKKYIIRVLSNTNNYCVIFSLNLK